MGISEVYTDEVHNQLTPYANWDPGAPMEPGDYGTLDGDNFVPIGNVRDLGVTFRTKKESERDHKTFSSEGVRKTDVSANASGNAGPIGSLKAALRLDFSRANSVFFNAAGCLTEAISNNDALGKQLIKLYDQGVWKKKYVVVSHVIRAEATTVIISREAGTTLFLEAEGDVETIDLADASVRLRPVDNGKRVSYVVASEEGMTPLMKLFRIKATGIFGHGPGEFGPALAVRGGAAKSASKKPPKRTELVGFEEMA